MMKFERLLVVMCCVSVSWFGARTWHAVTDHQMSPATLDIPSAVIPSGRPAPPERWPRNPFRISGAPSDLETMSDSALPDSSTAEVEGLQVRAIAGGPPWRAVLSRVPGFQGDVVVETGDSVGHYKIESIDSASVVMRAGDSTLTVTLQTFRKPEIQ